MAAFRLLAWVLVAISIALLGADGISSLESCKEACVPVMRSTADILADFGLEGFGPAAGSGGALSQAASTVLSLPLWGVTGVIGVVLTLIFRPMD